MGRVALKGGALTAPLPPALVTVGDGTRENVLTVAWTGILATVPPRTYISVRRRRHSHALLLENGEFVIHLPPASLVRAVDFCGMYTGAKVDKFERMHLTRIPSQQVLPPTIAECPIAIECKVIRVEEMGSHDVFYADIVQVTADESIIDAAGKLRFEQADLLAYAHGEYYKIGRPIAVFGHSAVKKKKTPGGNPKGKRQKERKEEKESR